MDDDQLGLIAALQRRDRAAWGAAVDRHLRELYGFVFHLVGGDRATAEELNQETWLEAIDGIGRCDAARGDFRSWLFGVARRRVALHYRRRALIGGSMSGDQFQFQQVAASGDGAIVPEDALEQVERTAVVRAAMLALPADRRQALVWKYVEGLSVEAIAGRMGKTAKAVESLLSRAREQMRGLLGAYMTPGGGRQRAIESVSDE